MEYKPGARVNLPPRPQSSYAYSHIPNLGSPEPERKRPSSALSYRSLSTPTRSSHLREARWVQKATVAGPGSKFETIKNLPGKAPSKATLEANRITQQLKITQQGSKRARMKPAEDVVPNIAELDDLLHAYVSTNQTLEDLRARRASSSVSTFHSKHLGSRAEEERKKVEEEEERRKLKEEKKKSKKKKKYSKSAIGPADLEKARAAAAEARPKPADLELTKLMEHFDLQLRPAPHDKARQKLVVSSLLEVMQRITSVRKALEPAWTDEPYVLPRSGRRRSRAQSISDRNGLNVTALLEVTTVPVDSVFVTANLDDAAI